MNEVIFISNMVLTENFKCFASSVLFSNTAGNGIICADDNITGKGWYGTGGINDSVTAISQLTDTSNNRITCSFYGAATNTYGYLGCQASLNRFKTENTYGTNDVTGVTFFKVGSGTTAATANDCNLEDEISAENVKINLSSVHLTENGCSVLRFFVTVKNIGTEPISVSEIGMFRYLSIVNHSNNARADSAFLFGRSILPAPVAIDEQDLRMFVVDIKI